MSDPDATQSAGETGDAPKTDAPSKTAPQTDAPISTTPQDRGNANLIYILYLAGIVVGVTSIIAVVMAYMAKDEAPEWLQSHYRNQIHIFWKGLVYGAIGIVTSIILIGFLVLLATLIWYIVRNVKGMQALSKGEAYPNPDSWGF